MLIHLGTAFTAADKTPEACGSKSTTSQNAAQVWISEPLSCQPYRHVSTTGRGWSKSR
jgi:hypothetical protein